MTTRRALAAAAVLLHLAAPAAAAQGGLGFRADGATQGGFLAVTAGPGGSAAGGFYVTNTTGAPATVSIYAADALTGKTTGIVYGDRIAAGRAGSWITPDRSSVTVPAGEERLVGFSVQVPGGTPGGEHVGSVVIEQGRARSSAVAQVVRVVAPVLVAVPGGGGPQIQLDTATVSGPSTSGTSSVGIGLRNAGARMCSPKVSATLSGPGESGRTVTRQLDTVLARDGVTYPLPWPRPLAAGQYRIQVTASGCGATQTRTFVDELPSGDETGSTTVPEDTGGGTRKRVPRDTDASASPTAAAPSAPDVTLRREPTATTPAAGAGPGPGSEGGAGTGDTGADGNGAKGITEEVRRFLEEHAAETLQRAGAPIALLLVFGLVVVAQEAVDRRDPKLRLAPVHRDPDLPFGPEPEPDPAGHPSKMPPDLRIRQ